MPGMGATMNANTAATSNATANNNYGSIPIMSGGNNAAGFNKPPANTTFGSAGQTTPITNSPGMLKPANTTFGKWNASNPIFNNNINIYINIHGSSLTRYEMNEY